MQTLDSLRTELQKRCLREHPASRRELHALVNMNLDRLLSLARHVQKSEQGNQFETCAIINAKSGRCSQNCAWCAQSRHHTTNVQCYPLLPTERIAKEAHRVAQSGIGRFSLVTSGRKLSPREVREVGQTLSHIRAHRSIDLCVSAGLLTKNELALLQSQGMTRYHCNLETSRRYFPQLCTTHTYEEKIATIRAAQSLGLTVCSGGIFGMGENWDDRIDLALRLRELNVTSVPINILSPIAGTPLANQALLTDEEFLRLVAIYRIALPAQSLRLAGGRARFSNETLTRAMRAGINSGIVGHLLTTQGRTLEDDRVCWQAAGYTHDDTLTIDKKHIWHPYAGTITPTPVWEVVGAEGVHLRLNNGIRLLDGTSSWWTACHGYRHPKLLAAIHQQVDQLTHVMFGGLTHQPVAKLTQALLALTPKQYQKVFYVDSGSVAVEVALKMALQYQVARGQKQRTNFATIRAGYHGDTWHAMSVCDRDEGMHQLFGSTLPNRIYLDSPKSVFGGRWLTEDERALEKVFAEHHHRIAAFILEPILQGAGAMRFYHPAYLRKVRELTKKYDIVMIVDEIATGFGRIGRLFAQDYAGVYGDIMTVGKALTGGTISMAATLTTNEIANTISSHPPYAFMHGPTFMANPVACAAAQASLELIARGSWQHDVTRIEATLRRGLEPLRNEEGVKDVRVLGAVGVVEMEKNIPTPRLRALFLAHKVWIRPFGPYFYVMPPYPMTRRQCLQLCRAIADAVTWMQTHEKNEEKGTAV